MSQAGAQTVIHQSSPRLAIDWVSFGSAAGEGITFIQPGADSVVLNRVTGQDPSTLLGSLNANGQVFIINPNGILFGAGASVHVGGLLASTLDLSSADFMAGRTGLRGDPQRSAGVVNEGMLSVAPGGYVALVAPRVLNHGTIVTPGGATLLAAGRRVTLDLDGTGLVGYSVADGALQALAENTGVIQADAGRVVLTARAADALRSAVVNQSGRIQARTMQARAGRILLLGDMDAGEVRVAGSLDVSAPQGGDAGDVETSAARVHIEQDATVSMGAEDGRRGRWLIDPTDLTIGAGPGNGQSYVNTNALANALASGDVTVETVSAGNEAGNIFVVDPISWASSGSLTLRAHGSISVGGSIVAVGNGSLVLRADSQGSGNGTVSFVNGATVNLAGGGRTDIYYNPAFFNLPTDFSGAVQGGAMTAWALVNSPAQLQSVGSNLSGNFALGRDLDMSGAGGGAGFAPLGSTAVPFSGQFDGLGRTLTGLTVLRPGTSDVGLFARIGTTGMVRDLTLRGANVVGGNNTGALAGVNQGLVQRVGSSGSVAGGAQAGGLVGANAGSIIGSWAEGGVSGTDATGGLAGQSSGTITDAAASAAVVGQGTAGGLVGRALGGSISNSYASGAVQGAVAGGLLGEATGTAVSSSYWDIQASGAAASAGGTGLTSVQMMTSSSFTGWDLSSTWHVDAGVSRPLLRSFLQPLTVTAQAATKTYDGVGFQGGAGVSYSQTPNAALLGAVTYGGAAQGALHAGTYALTAGVASRQGGYLMTYQAGTLTVNPAALTVSTSDVSKPYDGTLAATGTAVVVSGTLYGSDNLTGGVFAFTDKNAGNNKTVTASGITVQDGNAGGNYVISHVANTASTISPRVLTATAQAANKVYDGNTSAAVGLQLAGLVGSETLVATAQGQFNTKDVATANLVTVSSVALADGSNGGLASNYSLAAGQTAAAAITPRALAVQVAAVDKVYDGITSAQVVFSDDRLPGDVFSLTGAAAFQDAQAGSGKAVQAANLLATGPGAANYALPLTVSGTGRIIPRTLTVRALDAGKLFDGQAFSGGAGVSATGWATGEGVHLLQGPAGYGGTAQGAVLPGTYTLTPVGLTLASPNYTLLVLDGELLVSPASRSLAAVQVASLVPGYDGSLRFAGDGRVPGPARPPDLSRPEVRVERCGVALPAVVPCP